MDINKRKKFEKTLGKFPNCKLYSIEVTPDENERGKYSPYRWEVVNGKSSEFDIFIDDNASVLTKTREFFRNNKGNIRINHSLWSANQLFQIHGDDVCL